jgi:hypothetical protein
MIKDEELKKGNLFLCKLSIGKPQEFCKAFWITSEGIVNQTGGVCPYNASDPIPLTPEWLERRGFKDGWLEFNGGCQLTVHKDGTAVVSGWDSATSGQSVEVPCEYLHQLQNLYFALTGEELKIEL